MRFTLFLLFLVIGCSIYGQSDSIEKALLFKKLQLQEITNDDFILLGKKWNKTIAKEKYPDLPLNDNDELSYSYIIEFQDIEKEKLFNRTLEWFSITYGIVPGYLYSNLKDGKIICPGSIDINSNTSSSYTYIVTIRDSKLLIEFSNVGYQGTRGGYYSGDIWLPEKIDSYRIDQVFPIILKDSDKWKFYLDMLKMIDEHFKNDTNSLKDYIANYDVLYDF